MMKTDGTIFWAHLAATVTQDKDGSLICRIVMSDITKLKHLEQEKIRLEFQNQRLQKAESLGRMAGAIAHHFNNHLQTVMGNLELVMAVSNQMPKIETYLTEAMKAVTRAAEVSGLMLVYLGQLPGKQDQADTPGLFRETLSAQGPEQYDQPRTCRQRGRRINENHSDPRKEHGLHIQCLSGNGGLETYRRHEHPD